MKKIICMTLLALTTAIMATETTADDNTSRTANLVKTGDYLENKYINTDMELEKSTDPRLRKQANLKGAAKYRLTVYTKVNPWQPVVLYKRAMFASDIFNECSSMVTQSNIVKSVGCVYYAVPEGKYTMESQKINAYLTDELYMSWSKKIYRAADTFSIQDLSEIRSDIYIDGVYIKANGTRELYPNKCYKFTKNSYHTSICKYEYYQGTTIKGPYGDIKLKAYAISVQEWDDNIN